VTNPSPFDGLPADSKDAIWRAWAARECLDEIVGQARADIIIGEGEPSAGWVYFGLDELVFISDGGVFGGTNEDRIMQAKFWKLGGATELQSSLARKRATVVFGSGSSILGPKKEMKKLYMLASAVRGGRGS